MKRRMKRLLAAALSAAMVITGSSLPAAAAVETEGDRTGTVAGQEETIPVSSDVAAERENNFNSGWKFYLGDNSSASGTGFDDSGWETVTLPHDFSISQDFTTSGEAESGFLPGGTGWYRKSFTLSEADAGKRIVLSFDGVYSDAYVYVNGTYVGENHYGYTSFAFDITDQVICDGTTENVVAVKVVNNVPSSRWYSGSGIYRDVTLIATDPVHVAYNGTYVTTPDIAEGQGTVQVSAEVDNESENNTEVTVRNTVYDSEGAAVSDTAEETINLSAGESAEVTASPTVSDPKLWSTDDPNLYFVRTEVYVSGTLTDTYDTEFGFRWYSFESGKGFYLNGEAVKLNGVCMHHDQGAAGSAAYYDAMYRQLSTMKEMGVNAVRTSHNPADEDFIDICNELGLLVVEEIFDGWVEAKNSNSNDFSRYFNVSLTEENGVIGGNSAMTWAEFSAKSVVRRDRNDPSVILWSLCNEVQEGTYWNQVGSYASIAQNLINWIKEEDESRPTTSGDNNRGSDSRLVAVINTILDNGGVAGFNYANTSDSLASLAEKYGGVIIASETSSATNSRGVYTSQANNADADGKLHLTSYDISSVSWGIPAHDSIYNTMVNDSVAGEFVWTGWDYIGEPTPWNGTGTGSVSYQGAVPNSSYFGAVDTAGFEKDTYYLYRSQWNQADTTLHLVTAWDSENMMYTDGNRTPVIIYSNAPKVELFRNGELIGTAVRIVHTTEAGHEYYTYTAESNNGELCTAAASSGADSLYATFNVAYETGTISAIAYDENGKEITETAGNRAVITPGEPARLEVSQSRTVMDADGQSLVYVEVEVRDEDGNPDTTAANIINFTLSGNGEIVGVDNGDQATTAKYQQKSVLDGITNAHIAAYAGKAAVIIKSSDQAGSFTVDVSSEGLEGGSASVTVNAADDGAVQEGLVSYTMVRDYSVRAGTEPELQTTAVGNLADGGTAEGIIEWEEITEDIYGTAGDYTVNGTLRFSDLEEQEDIAVIARLHVIADVAALRNISAVTAEGTAPDLPDTVSGVLADGTIFGEFNVIWEETDEEQFRTVGDIVTVSGTASIIGDETLPVTCTVRVAQAVNSESVNVAPNVSGLTQDIEAAYQSDNLNSIINGVTDFADNTNERWTNWNNRTNSATATLTFSWATAQLLSGCNLYYYYDNCAAEPESVEFQYSLNGTDYTTIGYTSELVQSANLGAEYSYTFDSVINPVSVRIILTQKNGTSGTNCVGIIEAEIMTFAGSVEYNHSAALSGITVDGTAVGDFDRDILAYTASGQTVEAETDVNAGITVLPVYTDGVVRILTVSEDGSEARMYEVKLQEGCAHGNTVVIDAKEATCTEEGYTGDVYCEECGSMIKKGTVIPAVGHSTVVQNRKEATCTEEGYTGDQVCTVCGEMVVKGEAIPAIGHSWDGGTVTKPATTEEEGIRTYTCTVCGQTRTETIPKLDPPEELSAPRVTVSVSPGENGKLTLTGKFEDYENSGKYYTVTGHGLLYMTKARLGAKSMTVNTAGRTRVIFSSYKDDGTYSYNMTPRTSDTKYVVRAYLTYTNEAGKTVYVYSSPVLVSYDALAE